MSLRATSAILVGALVTIAAQAAVAGPLRGSVLDGTSLAPIAGATVTLPDGQTTSTNRAGRFAFEDVAAGAVEVAISGPGHEPTTETVEVPAEGLDEAVFVLFTPGAAAELIEVEDDAPTPPPPGKLDLPREQITKIPGARGDALSTIRSLPGVANQPNGIIVIRGAAPEDSVITIDGIEVPLVYHFFGLQSILPSEFIQNIEFLPGGFGVESGRSTGGIINVVTRDETATKASGFAELSFINAAAFVQAPLSRKHGVQVTAALRRSIIDAILPAVVPDTVNFTAAPSYYDGQLRIDWRPSVADKLSAFVLTSYDRLSLISGNLDPNDPNLTGATFDNRTALTRFITSWTHGGDTALNRLTASFGTGGFRLDIAEQYLDIKRQTLEVRDDVNAKLNDLMRLRAGASLRLLSNDLDIRFPLPPQEGQPPPTSFSDLPVVRILDTLPNHAAAAYAAVDVRPARRTTLSAGLRLDYYDRISALAFGPRLQLTHEATKRWTLRGAVGEYSRPLDQAELVSTTLDQERATQWVLGGTYKVRDGLDATGSVFYTDRRGLVVQDPLLVATGSPTPYVNRGRGRSMGLELQARAQFDHFFGWLSYTLSRADRVDGEGAPRRLFDFDETHNLVALGSYQLGKWTFGARFQVSTGQPETPITGSVYQADVNIYAPTYGAVNSQRIEAAHALDVRIDRTWMFDAWKLSAFLDITNVYAHARVLGYTYNFDYSQREAITDLPILPAIGIRATI